MTVMPSYILLVYLPHLLPNRNRVTLIITYYLLLDRTQNFLAW